MREIETMGLTEMSATEMAEMTGGEYSVMWVLGYVFQKLADLPPVDERILNHVY